MCPAYLSPLAWRVSLLTDLRLLDCSLILLANSRMVITSGIETSLLTGLNSCLLSLFDSLFSFCLALRIEAKLLPLNSTPSSLFKALEIVSFNSLFLFTFFSLFSLVESPFNLFVALCSASFLLSKSDKFFFGKKGSQFVSGSNGNLEISSSGFHLDNAGNVTLSGSITAISGDIGGFSIGDDLSATSGPSGCFSIRASNPADMARGRMACF